MAHTVCCIYEDFEQLNRFIKENELHMYSDLLVQVFSGQADKSTIEEVQHSLEWLVPAAKVVGSTTAGEISAGIAYEHRIVISFTVFEKTSLSTSLLRQDDFKDSFEMGKALAKKLFTKDTKAIILFSSNFEVDSQKLIEGIHHVNPDVLISGGIAADNGRFGETLVFTESEMTLKGAAAVVLNSDHLQIDSFTNYKWQEIGSTLTVTNAVGNKIYSINDKKPIQILRQYLGDFFIEGLPKSGIEFPFIMEDAGSQVSVFISKVLKNGVLEVNRSIPTGKKITFAYADAGMIIKDSLSNMKRISKKPVESIFVYNCMARKMFMNDFTTEEMKMLQSIAPTTGFYTNGEILYKKGSKPQIIGNALTYLAISETDKKFVQDDLVFDYKLPDQLNTIMSMTHLMQAAQIDISQLNESFLTSEQYYRSLFNNNGDFVYSTDLNGKFTSVNPSFKKTFGYSDEEIMGKSAMKFINKEDIPRAKGHFMRTLKGKEQQFNVEIKNVQGEIQLFRIKTIPITINESIVGVYGIGHNITEQKRIEEKITQLAYFDYETGLPNRMRFTEQLEEMLSRAKKKKRMLAVIFIDMDRFKIINDSLGHYAGDSIMKELVARIQAALPKGAYFGRFGGDKFTLILTKNVSVDESLKIAKSIVMQISKSVFYEHQEFFVTASIGVSLYPNDGTNEDVLLKNADIAMNRSKKLGGNRITFFSTEMNEEAIMRLEMESYLRKALQKKEFFLCYQPLIDLATGNVYGSEALIRWNHPNLGLVSPVDFIPLAEETGIIEEIGAWVVRTACIQNKKWHDMGFDELSIAVNVSAHQFQQPNFILDVKQALSESGLEPHYLTLELTESAMLRNIEYSISIMRSLQDLGVKVSIDDFGTGYSSLSYLRNLPINILKIDRSFIQNLRDNTSDIAIVKAIITMGHGLSVKVVAEGVETKEQIDLLRDLECHYAQGFYLDAPLKSDEFESSLIKAVEFLSV